MSIRSEDIFSQRVSSVYLLISDDKKLNNVAKMTASYLVFYIFVTVLLQAISCQDVPNQQGEYSAGVVHFNNPKLLQELEKSLEESSLFNRTQRPVDRNKFGGIFLQNFASSLGHSLRMLAINEMGVTSMQVCFMSILKHL